jgi:hypothetical protein
LFAIIVAVNLMPHRLLIATRSYDPEMVADVEMVLVDFASSGHEYYWKARVRQILRIHFPVLADRLDAEGLVDITLTAREFDIFNQALRAIQPVRLSAAGVERS